MNSKELLEQATARARKLNDFAGELNQMEDAISVISKVELEVVGFDIRYRFGAVAEKLKQDILLALITVKNEKAAELEQLLGIQPVPEKVVTKKNCLTGETAVEQVHPEVKVRTEFASVAIRESADAVADTLAGILQEEAKRIEAPDNKSLGKYPPDKRPPKLSDDLYPDIKRMYMDENKQAKEIAEHYNVDVKYVNAFLAKHKLRRKMYDKSISTPKPAKQPEETERP
jgi:hypothetical protein